MIFNFNLSGLKSLDLEVRRSMDETNLKRGGNKKNYSFKLKWIMKRKIVHMLFIKASIGLET
jgi:hypothetical protein